MVMGRKPQFTAKQVERMRDMKAEGLRNHEIAKVFGVATSTISSYLRSLVHPVK
jgi:predicted transcriptional regulator